LLGWHPKGDKEVVSMNEIINEFKLEDVEKRPAVFNAKKLVWLNKVYMKRLLAKDIENLILNDPYLEDLKYYLEKTEYSKEKIYKIIELGKERANTIREIFETVKFFYYDFDYNKELLIWKDYTFEQIKNSLIQVKNAIENIPEDKFNYEYIKQVLDSLSEDKGYTYWPLRVALTGLEASPPPIDIMLVIGKEKTLKLIEKALEKLS
jgi:glutamyl/glutaminyl-tRNA synthetase